MNRLGTLVAIVAGLGLALFSGPRFVGAGLTLVEKGGGPGKTLRYRPRPGVKEKSTLTMHMTMQGAGLPGPVTGEMSGDLEWRVLGVAGEEFQVAVDETVSINVVVDPKSKPAPPPPTNLKMRYMLSNRGKVRDVQLESVKGAAGLPPEFSEQIRQTLEQVSVPWLPKEAVGPGARWVVQQDVELFGMRMAARSVYVLKGVSGERLDLGVQGTLTAKGDSLRVPGMPAGVRIGAVDIAGEVSGTIAVDLTRAAPVSNRLETTLRMAFRVEEAGRPQDVEMRMTMTLVLDTPAPAPAAGDPK